MDAIDHALACGLRRLALPLDPGQAGQLAEFVRLLAKWNQAYNLTAIRDPAAMVNLHILDSLAVAPLVSGQRIIDVGTGAGLPGLPLAVALPERRFVLIDSNAKKTRFVQQAVLHLRLANVTVVQQRAEHHLPERPFDTALTRAVASLAHSLRLTGHLLAEHGVLLAMKGQNPGPELAGLPPGHRATVIPLTVPGVDAGRCVVKIEHPPTEVTPWAKP